MLQFGIKVLGSSLRRFLHSKEFEEYDWQGQNEIQLRVFAEIYDHFVICETLDAEQLDAPATQETLKEFGLHIESRSSASTMALIKIKWSKNPAADAAAGTSSLQTFVRTNCTLSAHESDVIFLDDFEQQYTKFCHERKHLKQELVSATLLQKDFGITQKVLPVRYLIKDSNFGQKKAMKDKLMDFKYVLSAEFVYDLLDNWFVRDVLVGFFQVVVMIMSPAILIFGALITEYFFCVSFALDRTSAPNNPGDSRLTLLKV